MPERPPSVRATSRNPARGPDRAGRDPGRCDRRGQQGPNGSDEHATRRPLGRRPHGGARIRLGLRKLGEHRPPSDHRAVHRRGEAVRGPSGANGDEHRGRRCARQQELETPHLIASTPLGRAVLPLQPQRLDPARPGELVGSLQRRRPAPESTPRHPCAYLSGEERRIHPTLLHRRGPMRVATDYIRHAARAARKCGGDPLGGAPEPPDPEFFRTLAKALEEIAAGLERLGAREE